MKRLLILSCSQRKRSEPGLLPAIERYDGPLFGVTRKFLREQPDEALSIYILSAQFGLISAATEIPNYNRKMTAKRAGELHAQVLKMFNSILQNSAPAKLFIALGKNYWQALAGYERLLPINFELTIATGSQGRRQAELLTWLYNGQIQQNEQPQVRRGKVRLRGIALEFTSDEVLQIARQKLAQDGQQAISYQSWYVPIDGQRVAPKWLVSQLSGLPVSAFHTGDARRVLQQLGVEVNRC